MRKLTTLEMGNAVATRDRNVSTVAQRLKANVRLLPAPPSLLIVLVGIRISSVRTVVLLGWLPLRKLPSHLRVSDECFSYRGFSHFMRFFNILGEAEKFQLFEPILSIGES